MDEKQMGRKVELLEELKTLKNHRAKIKRNMEFVIWKSLDQKKAVRYTTEQVMASVEYVEESRVSYQKTMVKDAVSAFREELEELSAHRTEFELELSLNDLAIEINREERELIAL